MKQKNILVLESVQVYWENFAQKLEQEGFNVHISKPDQGGNGLSKIVNSLSSLNQVIHLALIDVGFCIDLEVKVKKLRKVFPKIKFIFTSGNKQVKKYKNYKFFLACTPDLINKNNNDLVFAVYQTLGQTKLQSWLPSGIFNSYKNFNEFKQKNPLIEAIEFVVNKPYLFKKVV